MGSGDLRICEMEIWGRNLQGPWVRMTYYPRLAGFSEQSRVLHTAPVRHHETHAETDIGRYTFAPKYDHPIGAQCSGPAPDMSGREPNTCEEKIRSRFGAQILGRRFSFTVAFAGIWQTASCENTL